MTFDVQQFIEDQDDWFTVTSFDNLDEAKQMLADIQADDYYSKSTFRIYSDECPN